MEQRTPPVTVRMMPNAAAPQTSLHVVLGNQLFAPERHSSDPGTTYFLAEDPALCTAARYHKKKLILVLAAMREYADELRQRRLPVIYHALDDAGGAAESYETLLGAAVDRVRASRLIVWEIEDRPFEDRMRRFAEEHNLRLDVRPSPMFLTARSDLDRYFDEVKKPRMASFYQRQRRRLGILVDRDGTPTGGKWSFDADNRERLPQSVELPGAPPLREAEVVDPVRRLVRQRFADHPGEDGELLTPVTRAGALEWLDAFLQRRFHRFGDYEDALCRRDDVLFHSVLSPLLNVGLITPDEVVEKALEFAGRESVPLNSLEGFVRQIIGWREFVRGVYRRFGDEQMRSNFFGNERRLAPCWYDGTTGVPPLDDAIRKTWRLGWCHHIERLMVLANLMNLSGIHPGEAYRWFLEMFVDSAEWVMVPNVFGMGMFADGGIFATKPYVCGSNYLLKMSDYGRGDWCDVVDGLYWGFVDRHRGFFSSNPRLAMMVRSYDRLGAERKERIAKAAQTFTERATRPPQA